MRIGFSVQQDCHTARVKYHVTLIALDIAHHHAGDKAFSVDIGHFNVTAARRRRLVEAMIHMQAIGRERRILVVLVPINHGRPRGSDDLGRRDTVTLPDPDGDSQTTPNYDKHVNYPDYSAGYDAAVMRASRLEDAAKADNEEGRNPTTGVWRLTERIRADA